MQDKDLDQLSSINRTDIAPEIRAALVTLGVRHTTFPSILLTDSLNALSYPYPAPMSGSWLSFQAAFMFVDAQQPINENINDGGTGDGDITVGLQGQPAGFFMAYKVSSAIGDNDPSSDWAIEVEGFFAGGQAYELPAFQEEFASGASNRGDALILVTEPTQAGPALCCAQLRQASSPNVLLQNGAPNMTDVNGNQLTVTVSGAPSNQRTTIQIATKVTDIYMTLMEIILASIFADAKASNSVEKISRIAPPKALAAVRNLRTL